MKKFFYLLPIFLCLSACSSSKIFYATFDSDPLGFKPNTTPPEAPTGDVIYTSNVCDPSINDLTVVTNPLLDGRALRYNNSNLPIYCRYLGFISKDIDAASQKELWIYWNGIFNEEASSSALNLWAGNGHFLSLGEIKFKQGTVYLNTATGTTSSFTAIGSYNSGERHFIIIHLDQKTNQFSVVILKNSGTINSGMHPVNNVTAFNSSKIALYAWFSEDVNSGSNYLMDNVTISLKDPMK